MSENTNNSQMRLRSSVSVEEKEQLLKEKKMKKKEELNRPFIKFTGKITYVREFLDCAIVCDDLIKSVETCAKFKVVGFDVEWPVSFKTGPGKAALIQISPDLETCFLLQISDLSTLPKGLPLLLAHEKIRLTGVNIKNDIKKLSRDFKGFDTEKILANCIDSGVTANTVLPFTQRWSMENLVGFLLKMRISKDKKVRMSKWNASPLSKEQQVYAATDSYASLLLYKELRHRQLLELLKKVQPDGTVKSTA